MRKEIIVLGAGPGGYIAAIKAAKLGAKVKLIEQDEVGGTCLNRGCIPTKALLHVLSLYDEAKRGEGMGLEVQGLKINFKKLYAYKDEVVKRLRQGIHFLLEENNIELVKGKGYLTRPGEIRVGDNKYEAQALILATGSRPFRPSSFSFDNKYIFTSDEILSLEEVPSSMLIIGAGAIGLEFATIFSSLGTKVVLIEMLPQIIPSEDEEIAALLAKELSKKGIIIKTRTKVTDMTIQEGKVKIRVSSGEEVTVEKVLVAVGRSLNLENLGLEGLGLKTENGKISVNNYLETNIPGVFAIGDITAGPLLAHKASSQAIIAAANACGEREEFLMGDIIPSCIYTSPEVARVGLTEKEARAKGYQIKVGKFPFRNLGKAQAISQVEGLTKVIADSETGEILGVHIIGPAATELISEVSLAKRMEATYQDIATTCHPHPTLSEVLMEACHAVNGQAIHLP